MKLKKSQKLSLGKINLQSFVTNDLEINKLTIKGGDPGETFVQVYCNTQWSYCDQCSVTSQNVSKVPIKRKKPTTP